MPEDTPEEVRKKARGSRTKGMNGERELSGILGEHCHKISRSGYTGPDLIWRGRFVEVKRYASPISKKIRRILDDVPILMERADRDRWFVHLRLDDLLDMLDERARGVDKITLRGDDKLPDGDYWLVPADASDAS